MKRFKHSLIFLICLPLSLFADGHANNLAEAKQAFERGDYASAEQFYMAQVQMRRSDPLGWANLGVVLLRECKFKEAVESLKHAIALDPNDSVAYTALGAAYYCDERYDDAIDALTRGVVIEPKNPILHQYLAMTCSKKGFEEAAKKESDTATQLSYRLIDVAPPKLTTKSGNAVSSVSLAK